MPQAIAAAVSVFAGTLGVGAVAANAIFVAVQGALSIGLALGLTLLSSIFTPKGPRPEDVQAVIRSASASRIGHYGRVKVGGVLMFVEADNNGILAGVIAVATHRIHRFVQFYADDQLLGEGDGLFDLRGDEDRVRIESRRGLARETPYTHISRLFPEYTANRRGDGIASVSYELYDVSANKTNRIYPSGANTAIRSLIEASDEVYDPRTDTTGYTDNAALIIRHYMTSPIGMRLPERLVSTPEATAMWIEAANICDERVPLADGTDEARYRLWGSYDLDQERPVDVLKRWLATCNGRRVDTPDGGIAIRVWRWEEPTVVVDESMIIAIESIQPGLPPDQHANTITAKFLSVESDYQAVDALPWVNEVDRSERGEFPSDLDLVAVPSPFQARRLMKAESYAKAPDWICSLVLNLSGLAVVGQRFVRIKLPAFDVDEVFEIDDPTLLFTEEFVRGVQIDGVSMPAAAYEWSTDEEGAEPIATTITVDRTLEPPSGVTAARSANPTGDGEVIRIEVDTPSSPSLTIDYEIRAADADEGDPWVVVATDTDRTVVYSSPIDDRVFDVRVRLRSPTDRLSEWVETDTAPDAA